MSTLANGDLREVATDLGITPVRCDQCGTPSWRIGYDDGRDRDYLGYQCGCGNVVGLSRGHILRRARQIRSGQ